MQKMIVVKKDYTSEINSYLYRDWRIVSVTPLIKCVDRYDTTEYGAYVVIEERDGINYEM